MERTVLLFGSNTGDSERIIREAARLIQEIAEDEFVVSSLYLSEPWGFNTQEWFLNTAVSFLSSQHPTFILNRALEIEREFGRCRNKASGERYESRTLDIDLIFFGDSVCETDLLTLPHPRMHLRRFVLTPLCDIIPQYIHPLFNKSVLELLNECSDTSKVDLYKNEWL